MLADDLGASLEALEALDAAAGVVAAPRDWLVDLGLDGADPGATLEAARTAWEAGDEDAARSGAEAAAATLQAAPAAGRARATTIGAAVAASLLLVLLVIVLLVVGRHRGRGRTVQGITAAAVPYATLPDHAAPAEPTAARRPSTKEPPERDGRKRGGPRAPVMGVQRARPSHEILSGATGDVYFARATSILEREGLDPIVTMEVFCRRDAVLCGIGEATNLLGHVLNNEPGAIVEALEDGDRVTPKEVVLRIQARYRAFALYETAILGMLAQSTGWATAARECVDAAAPHPVISFGARHVHPDITDVLDYAAILGGCVGASTPAGARLAGLNPTGTMPHSLVLIFGDTVRASEAFDRDMPPDVPRIVLVDTFKDEAEEALRVAYALGDRLYGIRLDTPSERGRVTAALVTEVRARLDQAGFQHVTITVSGGLTPDRIRYFLDEGAQVDSFAVGSYISGATPIDFTGDIKEIDGSPIAKRGRIPGRTDSPRLRPLDLAQWRDRGDG